MHSMYHIIHEGIVFSIFAVFFPWMVPYMVKYLDFSFFDKECINFFTNVIEESSKTRKEGDKVSKTCFLQVGKTPLSMLHD